MDRNELVGVVGKIIPFLQTKGEIQEFSTINSSGTFIEGYDGYNAIRIEHGLPVTGLIPGDIFFKLISSIKTKEIELEKKNDSINIKTKTLVGTIKCLTDISYPKLDWKMVDEQTIPPNYKEALQVCRFAVSSDIALGCRTGIIFYKKYAFAIDRYSLMMVNLGAASEEIYVLTPEFAAKLLDHNLLSFCIRKGTETEGEDQIVFSAENKTKLFGSLLTYDLDVSPIAIIKKFRSENSIQVGVLPAKMKDALSRHEIMLDEVPDLEKRVKLEFSGNALTIRSTSGRGRIIEKIKLDTDLKGASITFLINPLLLEGILKYTPAVIIYQEPLMVEFVENHFNYFVMGEAEE